MRVYEGLAVLTWFLHITRVFSLHIEQKDTGGGGSAGGFLSCMGADLGAFDAALEQFVHLCVNIDVLGCA